MASCPEKLLEKFEAFQVEQILAEIKKEWVFDDWGVVRGGERETETSSPGSSGSTSYLRARALDPRSLSAVDLRVVCGGH